MTRDEIYDHLAQVYLGKKNKPAAGPSKKQFSAWLAINVIITVVIFATSFYGLTAFLARRSDTLKKRVVFALNKGPIQLGYDLRYPNPQIKRFSLAVPNADAQKYGYLEFDARGAEGRPGTLRVEIRDRFNETASVFVGNIGSKWTTKKVQLKDFNGITDWSSVSEISFVLESWNVDSQKGLLLLDDVCFSS